MALLDNDVSNTESTTRSFNKKILIEASVAKVSIQISDDFLEQNHALHNYDRETFGSYAGEIKIFRNIDVSITWCNLFVTNLTCTESIHWS